MTPIDRFGRHINYLRVSVTDRCNLRCVYCMPPEGVPWMPHEEILRFEEIAEVVRVAVGMGFSHIRLTGGEPLVRPDLPELVRQLHEIAGIEEITMTTNGILLGSQARRLREAGLHRLNVSLDTMDPLKFHNITRQGRLEQVLEGIAAAEEAGFTNTKVNVVLMEGVNDDEIEAFALRSMSGWNVRFIEPMPISAELRPVPNSEVKRRLEALGPLEPAEIEGNGPARTFRLPGAKGTLGFITPLSHAFCADCNRLRLTADGYLRPCLLSDSGVNVKQALRGGASTEEIEELVRSAIGLKPESHTLAQGAIHLKRTMSQIGG